MENIENTLQIQGDFTSIDTQDQIKEYLKKKPDVVMSDMAVNTTGIKNIEIEIETLSDKKVIKSLRYNI